MRRLFPILLALFCLLGRPAVAQENQLDASETLFTVMAAINAAGYDADALAGTNHPLRMAVRQEILKRNPEILPELKAFYVKHRKRDWSSELSQYISFALTVTGPPEFAFRYTSNELPLDAAALDGFGYLLGQFYKQANIPEIWQQIQPAIEAELEKYQPGVIASVQQIDGYLQTTGSANKGRQFQILLDFMGAPRQVHTRSYGREFYLVLTEFAEPPVDYIRHAYLQYSVDSFLLRQSKEINEKKSLIDFALGAPLLPEQNKEDFVLLTMNSFVKAIESRLAPPTERAGLVDQALREGYILTPYFYESLAKYEKSEQSMRFYFPEMIKGIDLRKESARLDKVQFLETRPEEQPKPLSASEAEYQKVALALDKAEDLYASKQYAAAQAAYRKVVDAGGDQTLKARAYYGLARIATLEKGGINTAEQLFVLALNHSPDPVTECWSHVYLARIADIKGERKVAVEHYQAALSVKDGSDKARQAARDGLAQSFAKPESQ